jgi:hypothetical protein
MSAQFADRYASCRTMTVAEKHAIAIMIAERSQGIRAALVFHRLEFVLGKFWVV